MGPKHGGRGDDDNDGPGGRGGGGHGGGQHGGGGQQGGPGGSSGGGDAMQLQDRVKKIHEHLQVLKEHGHINDNDMDKIMQILPNKA